MLVLVNLFIVVSIFSAQFTIFCLKAILKKPPSEKPYGEKSEKIDEEQVMKTAREKSPTPIANCPPQRSRDIIQVPSPESLKLTTDARIILVPKKTDEQKNCDARYRLVLEAGKKRRADYSAADSASYDEEEDTLFGVHSLLTDATTSMVPPRSVNGNMPSVAQIK